MNQWVDIVLAQNLPEGKRHVAVVHDHAIAVFNLKGELYAIEDSCTHQGLPLSEGAIEGTEIECPFHGARFCLKTGNATCAPAYAKLKTFPTRIHQNTVQVLLSERHSSDII